MAVSGAAAVVTTWAGWTVTEVGRQPWIVYQYLRTEDAVTSSTGLWWWFGLVFVIYAVLFATAVAVLLRMARTWRGSEPTGSPYGPKRPVDGDSTAVAADESVGVGS